VRPGELLVAFAIPSAAAAATIHVPGDQPTIQAGIGAATPGDTVEVACGTYSESKLTGCVADQVGINGNFSAQRGRASRFGIVLRNPHDRWAAGRIDEL
jgi:hypothetical protein